MSNVYFIGDIHGHYDRLRTILHDHTKLIDNNGQWRGGESTMCFIGDYTDRGPDGIATINFVMRLQAEAEASGGRVICLLGNHEVFLLAAYHFALQINPDGRRFGGRVTEWKAVGGVDDDLKNLEWSHVQWLSNLPAMAKINNRLCIHADSLFYLSYGRSIDEVNKAIHKILQSRDTDEWDVLVQRFIFRQAFYGIQGEETAREFLNVFGGKQIIHGHTPIRYMTRNTATSTLKPYVYAGDLCINIDPGLYMGGQGFVLEMQAEEEF